MALRRKGKIRRSLGDKQTRWELPKEKDIKDTEERKYS